MSKEKDKKFKLVTIGAGIHSETNIYPSLTNHLLDNIEKLAVCDLDEEKAKKMAENSGFKRTYLDYREMIQEEKPDGVIICLNAKLHPGIVIDCLKMGVDVLVEKAPARTVEEAKEMASVSSECGKIVMIAHQKRHSTAYSKAKEIVSNTEDFGNMVQIEAKMHGMPVFPNVFTVLMEWQIHNIDLIRNFGGNIQEIAVMSKQFTDQEASLVLLLRFENGCVGSIGWGTYGGPGQFCERLEVISDKGKGVIVNNAYDLTYYDGSWSKYWAPDWNPNIGNQSYVLNGYVGEIMHFIDCAKKNIQPSPSIEDGVKSLEAIYEIARQAGIEAEWKFIASKY